VSLGIFEDCPEWEGVDAWMMGGMGAVIKFQEFKKNLEGAGLADEEATRHALAAIQFRVPEEQVHYINGLMPFVFGEEGINEQTVIHVAGQLSLFDCEGPDQLLGQPSS